jgi:uncharacterized protein YecE (DUF72 family)
MDRQIRVGTSGWTYPHWSNIFYPLACQKSRWLEYYTEHFDTVELNATFYRLPKAKTVEGWKRRTPDFFLWAVKASKYITHTKRLTEPTAFGAILCHCIGPRGKIGSHPLSIAAKPPF